MMWLTVRGSAASTERSGWGPGRGGAAGCCRRSAATSSGRQPACVAWQPSAGAGHLRQETLSLCLPACREQRRRWRGAPFGAQDPLHVQPGCRRCSALQQAHQPPLHKQPLCIHPLPGQELGSQAAITQSSAAQPDLAGASGDTAPARGCQPASAAYQETAPGTQSAPAAPAHVPPH